MRLAFQGANYFARASAYQTSMSEWGAAERRVIEQASLAEFDRICADVAGAGFTAMELWMAHAFPKFMTPFLADEMKAIWQRHGLEVISFSCSLGDPVRWPRWTRLCFQAAQMLGIPLITSGIGKEAAPAVYAYCRESGIKVAVENHPEKHPDEIRSVIGDYGDYIGACVDTGWFATQGYPAQDAIQALKDHLFHVHLKDVREAGEHNSTRLGTGVVDIAACVRTLKAAGYDGTISIEQESPDHDPTADVAAGRKLVEQLWQQA
jgi:sugar phosphate isomerase/epimerase